MSVRHLIATLEFSESTLTREEFYSDPDTCPVCDGALLCDGALSRCSKCKKKFVLIGVSRTDGNIDLVLKEF